MLLHYVFIALYCYIIFLLHYAVIWSIIFERNNIIVDIITTLLFIIVN